MVKRSLFLSIAGAALVLGTVSGCGHSPSAAGAPAPTEESKTVTVRVVRPERKTIPRVIEQPGQIQPFEQTPLYARLSGYVEKVNVESIGKRVHKGEVLAELHVPEMEKELKQKQALVEQARAEIEQARKMIVVAEARITELEAARIRAKASCERWRKELRRIQDLVQRKVIDEQTRDETALQFESAEGALQEADAHIRLAQAQLDKARADAKTAEAHLGVAEADSEQTAELLKYREIKAPFDGIVSRRNVSSGDFVQPSLSAVSGKAAPLFVVDRMDIVRIFVEVPEADAVFVSDGSRRHHPHRRSARAGDRGKGRGHVLVPGPGRADPADRDRPTQPRRKAAARHVCLCAHPHRVFRTAHAAAVRRPDDCARMSRSVIA